MWDLPKLGVRTECVIVASMESSCKPSKTVWRRFRVEGAGMPLHTRAPYFRAPPGFVPLCLESAMAGPDICIQTKPHKLVKTPYIALCSEARA